MKAMVVADSLTAERSLKPRAYFLTSPKFEGYPSQERTDILKSAKTKRQNGGIRFATTKSKQGG
jgi:hypothetical protein